LDRASPNRRRKRHRSSASDEAAPIEEAATSKSSGRRMSASTESTASILAERTVRRDTGSDHQIVRVLAGDGEPGEAAGELPGRHDQHG
jgi:hypothetical protein